MNEEKKEMKKNEEKTIERQLAGLKSQLRDCHDLLNDCGYYFVNGVWTDSENPDGDEEE